MAPPPPKRLLSKEDAPGAPEWLERLLGPLNAFINPAATALGQGLTFRENFAGEVRTVDVLCPEEWVAVSDEASGLGAGWSVNITTSASPRLLSYRKTQDGMVEVRGRVTFSTGTPTGANPIINFPNAGWLPDRREVFDAFSTTPAILSAFGTSLKWESGGFTNISTSGDVFWMASDRSPPRWATPVDVKLGTAQHPFPGRPGSVQVLRATVQGNLTAPAVVTALDAEFINLERAKASPGVRIHRVWGLVPGMRYTLTILVLPE